MGDNRYSTHSSNLIRLSLSHNQRLSFTQTYYRNLKTVYHYHHPPTFKMQFAAALLLAPLAAALPTIFNPAHNGTAPDPSTYENVDISSFSVLESIDVNTAQVTGIERVDFVINGNTTCSAEAPGTAGKVFGCASGSPYSFGLINGTTSQFGLRLYKQTSPL